MMEPSISTAIDFDELEIEKRREAAYNGILMLIARLLIVFSGLTLIYVQIYTGFESEAVSQTIIAIYGLTILVSLISLSGILIGIFIFKFFQIYYEKFCEMQENLKTLHEKRLLDLKNI